MRNQNRFEVVRSQPNLAVERFHDDTRHLIFYETLQTPARRRIRLYLNDQDFSAALFAQDAGKIKILQHYNIIEGHIVRHKRKNKKPHRRKKQERYAG